MIICCAVLFIATLITSIYIQYLRTHQCQYGHGSLEFDLYHGISCHIEPFGCPFGYFALSNNDTCQQWLSCDDIKRDVSVTNVLLGQGAVKKVYIGKLKGHNVALSFLTNISMLEDFKHNVAMLQELTPPPNKTFPWLVQLVGWCFNNPAVQITEFHNLGTADKVHQILEEKFPEKNTLATRFKLCQDYVKIIHTLHSQVGGPRVLCDSNDPIKALSQFLISDDIGLILNDVDALPVVQKEKEQLIICGHKEISGEFIAPEQLWPFEDESFDEQKMPGYDEKTDVWKIPDVCNELLRGCRGATGLKLKLFNIHSKCKLISPKDRITSEQVLQEYYRITDINFNSKC